MSHDSRGVVDRHCDVSVPSIHTEEEEKGAKGNTYHGNEKIREKQADEEDE